MTDSTTPPEAPLPRWLHPLPVTLLALGGLGGFTGLALKFPRGSDVPSVVEALGDLHPLMVHFPAALLPTAVLLELGGRWSHRFATRLLLALSALMSASALGPGWVLALDRNATTALTLHLWTGVTVAVLSLAAVWLHHHTRNPRPYRLALFGALGAVAFAGHLGAGLTHGEMLEKWRRLFTHSANAPATGHAGALPPLTTLPTAGAASLPPPAPGADPPSPPAAAGAKSVYAEKIAPILERTCVSCHGEKKQKGDLRLDSPAALLAPSESGKPAVVPGAPDQSPLLTRILLPADDDDHMPPTDKPQPTAGEIELLRSWITQHAAAELK